MRAHGTTPWWIPLIIPLDNSPFAWWTLPCSRVPLTYLESLLCVWCDPCPLWSQVACKLTSPSPFPPIPFSRPQQFPIPVMCPSTMTSRHRLHIVRYKINTRKYKDGKNKLTVTEDDIKTSKISAYAYARPCLKSIVRDLRKQGEMSSSYQVTKWIGSRRPNGSL